MKFTYTDLLGQTQELISNQPDEVKVALEISKNYSEDGEIKDILNTLSQPKISYYSYSHS
jgi:hypothetical protein